MLDQEYWDSKYKNQLTGWDIGHASPPLIEFAKQFPKDTAILIPGAGNGHEAITLSNLGYTNITVIDISDIPLQRIRNHNEKINLIHDNFFHLDATFDLILEQTFFCALDPALRKDYVQKMHDVLNHKGTLAGVLFNRIFEQQGPPFGGTQSEYQSLFEPTFEIQKLELCYNSIPQRLGSELFFVLTKQ